MGVVAVGVRAVGVRGRVVLVARVRELGLVTDCATAPTISPARPIPRTAAATRCPRSTSTTESDASRPTIISTKTNSIMIAPV